MKAKNGIRDLQDQIQIREINVIFDYEDVMLEDIHHYDEFENILFIGYNDVEKTKGYNRHKTLFIIHEYYHLSKNALHELCQKFKDSHIDVQCTYSQLRITKEQK